MWWGLMHKTRILDEVILRWQFCPVFVMHILDFIGFNIQETPLHSAWYNKHLINICWIYQLLLIESSLQTWHYLFFNCCYNPVTWNSACHIVGICKYLSIDESRSHWPIGVMEGWESRLDVQVSTFKSQLSHLAGVWPGTKDYQGASVSYRKKWA